MLNCKSLKCVYCQDVVTKYEAKQQHIYILQFALGFSILQLALGLLYSDLIVFFTSTIYNDLIGWIGGWSSICMCNC